MKKLLSILSLLISINTFATQYYVSASGNDANNGLSPATAFLTIPKASATATTSGTIYVGSGTFDCGTTKITLALGVSIEGQHDMSTHVITHYYTSTYLDGFILMKSGTDGTVGNQTISYLNIDGSNLAATVCIVNLARSYVTIHDCYIHDFVRMGYFLKGTNNLPSSNYCTHDSVYNCRIDNCADRQAFSTGGNIQACGYNDLTIHDNELSDTVRALGHNGNIYSNNYEPYCKNFKFYNNTCIKLPYEVDTQPSFILEMWDSQGGMEVYNNIFRGSEQAIDLGGASVTKGSSTYGFWIHDNTFTQTVQYAAYTVQGCYGINIEGDAQYILIDSNYFKNECYGVRITVNHTTTTGITNVTVRHNVFDHMGYLNGAESYIFAIGPTAGSSASLVRDIFYDYNTLIGNGSKGGFYFAIANTVTARNLNFRNNIVENIVGFGYVVIGTGTGTKDSVFIQNNVAFNNSFTNNIYSQGGATAPTHYVTTTAIKLNPLFVSTTIPDYHLTAGSPAIAAGLNLGYGTDIGAYPYGSKITPTVTWATPANITYGTGLGASQLNASFGGVPGTAVYTPGSGTVLNAGAHQRLIVTFTPSDQSTYNPVADTVYINVNQATATLAATNTTQTYTGLPLQPTINTTPAGLTVINTTYNGIGTIPTNAAVYSNISGLTNANYTATPISYNFTINKATTIITVSNLTQTYTGSPLPVTVTTNPNVSGISVTYNGSATVPTNAGSYTVVASLTNANYTATPDTVTFVIAKANATAISWTPANITYNAALGASQLNATDPKTGNYLYSPAAGFIPIPPSQVLSVTFTPSDTNLLPQTVQRTITVSQGAAVITMVSSTLSQSFDNTPKYVVAVTTPSGIDSLQYVYDDSHTSIGTHTGHVHLSSPLYTATDVPFTLTITSNVANIFMTNYTGLVYNTLQQMPTVTCAYSYALTYNGSSTAPSTVGSYITIATINDGIHTGADTVVMTIIKANISGTWPQIANQTYLYKVTSGILNASTAVAGTGAYNVNVGDTLHAGVHTLIWTFTPTDATDYNTLVLTNTFTVNQGTATFTVFNLLQTYDSTAKWVGIITNPAGLSGVTVTYSGLDSAVNAGSYLINISLNNSDYTATPVTTTLIIQKANPILNYPAQIPIEYGTPLTTLNFNATSNKAGYFTYNYVVGTVLPTGTTTLTATFHPTNPNYNSKSVSTTISIYGSSFIQYYIIHGKTIYLNYPQ